MGLKSVATKGSKRYARVFRDDYTRCSWIFFLASERDTSVAFELFLAAPRLEHNAKVITIILPISGESLVSFLTDKEFSASFTPRALVDFIVS